MSGFYDMKTISVDVVSHVLTTFTHCSRCELLFDETEVGKKAIAEDLEHYPEDLKEDFVRLSDSIRDLFKLYRHRIRIRLIDAQSPMGIYKSIIHRIRQYPAFVIENKDVYSGWDRKVIEDLIDKHIRSDKA